MARSGSSLVVLATPKKNMNVEKKTKNKNVEVEKKVETVEVEKKVRMKTWTKNYPRYFIRARRWEGCTFQLDCECAFCM